MAGSPSGIAATARLTEVINISKGGRSLYKPIRNTKPQITSAAMPRTFPVLASLFCKGVSGVSSSIIILAICPTCVSIPVAITTPIPLPYSTVLVAMTILILSARLVSGSRRMLAFFSTG